MASNNPDIRLSAGIDPKSLRGIRDDIRSSLSNINANLSRQSRTRIRQQLRKIAPTLDLRVNKNSLAREKKRLRSSLGTVDVKIRLSNLPNVRKRLQSVPMSVKTRPEDLDRLKRKIKDLRPAFRVTNSAGRNLRTQINSFLKTPFKISVNAQRVSGAGQVAAGTSGAAAAASTAAAASAGQTTNVAGITQAEADAARRESQKLEQQRQKNIEKTRKEQEKANKQTKKNTRGNRGWNASIAETNAELSTFASRLGFTTTRLSAYIVPATAFFQISRGIQFAAQSIREINTSTTELTQILGNNEERAKGLADQVLSIASRFGVAGSELLQTTVTIAQAGEKFRTNVELLNTVRGLAKTQLGATFGEVDETSRGVIAALNQFNLSGRETIRVLDIANQLAKDFAVSSGDIFTAVQRGGGAFSAVGGSLEEFGALVATFREITGREATAIGTGIKTISTRLFKQNRLQLLKEFGADIRNAEGDVKSITELMLELGRVSQTLNKEQRADFINELVGTRRSGFILSFVQDFEKFEDAIGSANTSAGSLNRDVLQGLDRIDVRLTQVRATFEEFFNTLSQSRGFNRLIDQISSIGIALGGLANVASTIAPSLLQIGALGLGIGAIKGVPKFLKGANIFSPGRFGDARRRHLTPQQQAIQANTQALQANTRAQLNKSQTLMSRRRELGLTRQQAFSQRMAQRRQDLAQKIRSERSVMRGQAIAARQAARSALSGQGLRGVSLNRRFTGEGSLLRQKARVRRARSQRLATERQQREAERSPDRRIIEDRLRRRSRVIQSSEERANQANERARRALARSPVVPDEGVRRRVQEARKERRRRIGRVSNQQLALQEQERLRRQQESRVQALRQRAVEANKRLQTLPRFSRFRGRELKQLTQNDPSGFLRRAAGLALRQGGAGRRAEGGFRGFLKSALSEKQTKNVRAARKEQLRRIDEFNKASKELQRTNKRIQRANKDLLRERSKATRALQRERNIERASRTVRSPETKRQAGIAQRERRRADQQKQALERDRELQRQQQNNIRALRSRSEQARQQLNIEERKFNDLKNVRDRYVASQRKLAKLNNQSSKLRQESNRLFTERVRRQRRERRVLEGNTGFRGAARRIRKGAGRFGREFRRQGPDALGAALPFAFTIFANELSNNLASKQERLFNEQNKILRNIGSVSSRNVSLGGASGAATGAGIGSIIGSFVPIPGLGTLGGAAVGAGLGAGIGAVGGTSKSRSQQQREILAAQLPEGGGIDAIARRAETLERVTKEIDKGFLASIIPASKDLVVKFAQLSDAISTVQSRGLGLDPRGPIGFGGVGFADTARTVLGTRDIDEFRSLLQTQSGEIFVRNVRQQVRQRAVELRRQGVDPQIASRRARQELRDQIGTERFGVISGRASELGLQLSQSGTEIRKAQELIEGGTNEFLRFSRSFENSIKNLKLSNLSDKIGNQIQSSLDNVITTGGDAVSQIPTEIPELVNSVLDRFSRNIRERVGFVLSSVGDVREVERERLAATTRTNRQALSNRFDFINDEQAAAITDASILRPAMREIGRVAADAVANISRSTFEARSDQTTPVQRARTRVQGVIDDVVDNFEKVVTSDVGRQRLRELEESFAETFDLAEFKDNPKKAIESLEKELTKFIDLPVENLRQRINRANAQIEKINLSYQRQQKVIQDSIKLERQRSEFTIQNIQRNLDEGLITGRQARSGFIDSQGRLERLLEPISEERRQGVGEDIRELNRLLGRRGEGQFSPDLNARIAELEIGIKSFRNQIDVNNKIRNRILSRNNKALDNLNSTIANRISSLRTLGQQTSSERRRGDFLRSQAQGVISPILERINRAAGTQINTPRELFREFADQPEELRSIVRNIPSILGTDFGRQVIQSVSDLGALNFNGIQGKRAAAIVETLRGLQGQGINQKALERLLSDSRESDKLQKRTQALQAQIIKNLETVRDLPLKLTKTNDGLSTLETTTKDLVKELKRLPEKLSQSQPKTPTIVFINRRGQTGSETPSSTGTGSSSAGAGTQGGQSGTNGGQNQGFNSIERVLSRLDKSLRSLQNQTDSNIEGINQLIRIAEQLKQGGTQNVEGSIDVNVRGFDTAAQDARRSSLVVLTMLKTLKRQLNAKGGNRDLIQAIESSIRSLEKGLQNNTQTG